MADKRKALSTNNQQVSTTSKLHSTNKDYLQNITQHTGTGIQKSQQYLNLATNQPHTNTRTHHRLIQTGI